MKPVAAVIEFTSNTMSSLTEDDNNNSHNTLSNPNNKEIGN